MELLRSWQLEYFSIMDITYLGHSSFKLKGKSASVVVDPFDAAIVGIAYPKVTAEIVIASHDHSDHNAIGGVTGTSLRAEPFVIAAPGEYEVNGISVFGFSTFHDKKEGADRGKNMITVIHVDDVVVGHLGDLGHTLSDKLVEEMGQVDVLLVPVGGHYTVGPADAANIVEQIEPSIVIPMHYKVSGMKEAFDDLVSVETFLKEVGAEDARREAKLTVSAQTLPEEREVIVLERV